MRISAKRVCARLSRSAALDKHLSRVWASQMLWLTNWLVPPLDCSSVTPQIALGGAFAPRHIAQLRKRGFTAVVDCREEATDDAQQLAEAGITFFHLPVRDRHAPSVALLVQGVDWVAGHLGRVDRAQVLVHCQEGIGRSPLLVACVLVAQGYAASQALGMVRSARSQAAPNVPQLQILLSFAREWPAAARALTGLAEYRADSE